MLTVLCRFSIQEWHSHLLGIDTYIRVCVWWNIVIISTIQKKHTHTHAHPELTSLKLEKETSRRHLS